MKHLKVESGTQEDSNKHSKPSMQKDMEVMIDQLRKALATLSTTDRASVRAAGLLA